MNRRKWQAARRSLPSPTSARARWRMLLNAARDVGALASGAAYEPIMGAQRLTSRSTAADKLADFSHLARDAHAVAFPVEGASAAAFAEAFLRQARAFAEVALPEHRTLYAAALTASAGALEGLLDLQRDADAERGRAIMGERD